MDIKKSINKKLFARGGRVYCEKTDCKKPLSEMTATVCISCYNGEAFIEEQLYSIVNQTVLPNNILIRDDSSSDRTVEKIKKFIDKTSVEVDLIYGGVNLGYSKSFELLVKKSTSDIVILCDQDDIWEPTRIELIKACLQNSDMVFADGVFYFENQIKLENSLHGLSIFETTDFEVSFFKNLLKQRYLGCQMAFRRKAMSKFLSIPKSATKIPMTHDNWWGLAGLAYLRCVQISTATMKYRRHQASVSGGLIAPSSNSVLSKLALRLEILVYLFTRSATLANKTL